MALGLTPWLLVALGGALGAVSRYGMDRAMVGLIGPTVMGTFAVNITGSFVRACYGHHPSSREEIEEMRDELENIEK